MMYLATEEMVRKIVGLKGMKNIKAGLRPTIDGCTIYFACRRFRILADSRDVCDLANKYELELSEQNPMLTSRLDALQMADI